MGVARVNSHGDADDGKVVAIAKSLISQLVLQVAHKGLVVEQFLYPGLVGIFRKI